MINTHQKDYGFVEQNGANNQLRQQRDCNVRALNCDLSNVSLGFIDAQSLIEAGLPAYTKFVATSWNLPSDFVNTYFFTDIQAALDQIVAENNGVAPTYNGAVLWTVLVFSGVYSRPTGYNMVSNVNIAALASNNVTIVSPITWNPGAGVNADLVGGAEWLVFDKIHMDGDVTANFTAKAAAQAGGSNLASYAQLTMNNVELSTTGLTPNLNQVVTIIGQENALNTDGVLFADGEMTNGSTVISGYIGNGIVFKDALIYTGSTTATNDVLFNSAPVYSTLEYLHCDISGDASAQSFTTPPTMNLTGQNLFMTHCDCFLELTTQSCVGYIGHTEFGAPIGPLGLIHSTWRVNAGTMMNLVESIYPDDTIFFILGALLASDYVNRDEIILPNSIPGAVLISPPLDASVYGLGGTKPGGYAVSLGALDLFVYAVSAKTNTQFTLTGAVGATLGADVVIHVSGLEYNAQPQPGLF